MKNFIENLEEIMTDDKYGVDQKTHIFVESEEISKLESFACNLLITENGGVNYARMTELRKAGYRVYPGEKDGFGWLSGCIEKQGNKQRKILVFG